MAESKHRLTIGQCATLACILEATAPKPGNVHRGADFDDATYLDFITSAVAIGPAMDSAARGASLGATVLTAVEQTRRVVDTNTNLGTVLLLAPLAKVPRERSCSADIENVLASLDVGDSGLVYEAIRLARPAGLGDVPRADIHGAAPNNLVEAMRLAADHDLVAKQYADNFKDLFQFVVPWLAEGSTAGWPLADVIVHAHLRWMSRYPDSLIARKCGNDVAEQAACRAERVLAAGTPGDEAYPRAVADLDFWLRSDGHRRNPGTTADMIAAGLFLALRDGIIEAPWRFYNNLSG